MEDMTIKLINRAIKSEELLRRLSERLGEDAWASGDRNSPEWQAFGNMRAMWRGAQEVLKDMGVRLCGLGDDLHGYWLDGVWHDYHEDGLDDYSEEDFDEE